MFQPSTSIGTFLVYKNISNNIEQLLIAMCKDYFTYWPND